MARHRIKLLAALVAAVALYGAWLWLRDAPIFAVQRVQVSGLSGPSAGLARGSLEQSARQMTTTHIDLGKLRAALSPYATVAALTVSRQLPHGIRISVREQRAVMALAVGGMRLPVGPGGHLLQGRLPQSAPVPQVAASVLPAGGVVRDAAQLRALETLDIAPAALRARTLRVAESAQGVSAYLRSGPQLIFGDTSRLHAKWAAAARILTDPSARGARYIDLRVPDRPAAQVGDPTTLTAPALAGPANSGAGSAGVSAAAQGTAP